MKKKKETTSSFFSFTMTSTATINGVVYQLSSVSKLNFVTLFGPGMSLIDADTGATVQIETAEGTVTLTGGAQYKLVEGAREG